MLCGGRSRNCFTGGWAKGMPLKESMPSRVEPTTVPFLIVTVGPSCLSSNGKETANTKKQKLMRVENMIKKNGTCLEQSVERREGDRSYHRTIHVCEPLRILGNCW